MPGLIGHLPFRNRKRADSVPESRISDSVTVLGQILFRNSCPRRCRQTATDSRTAPPPADAAAAMLCGEGCPFYFAKKCPFTFAQNSYLCTMHQESPRRSTNRAARSHGGKAMRMFNQKKSVSWTSTIISSRADCVRLRSKVSTPKSSTTMLGESMPASMSGRTKTNSISFPSTWR